MGIGARKKDNDMRDSQGKMVNPKKVGPPTVDHQETSGPGHTGIKNKQYNQTGPKATGPNYKQKDPNVVPFDGK